jgi:RNA 2',3'-cyclic 3'-phosphodiesterase
LGRLRLFTAVELPGEVKDGLLPILRECSLKFPAAKWVDPSQLHLTLRFLGDQEEGKLPALLDVLRAEGKKQRPFPIELGGLGTFPGAAKPAVLFVPVLQGAESLEALARDMGEGLRRAGIAFDDRDFRAHVTLGRIKTLKGDGAAAGRLDGDLSGGRWKMNVGQFVLFHSRLSQKGPIYTAVEKFILTG